MAEPNALGKQFADELRNSENTVWVGEVPILSADQITAMANDGLNTNHLNPLLQNLVTDETANRKIGTEDGLHLSVENAGENNVSETAFQIENLTDTVLPTLGGLAGATVMPFKEEWLVGADAQVNVNGRFVVVKAQDGEDLGPAGYKSTQTINTDLHIYSKNVDQPLSTKADALFGLVEEEIAIPQLDVAKNAENIDLSGILNNEQSAMSFAPKAMGFAPSTPAPSSQASAATVNQTAPAKPYTAGQPDSDGGSFSLIDADVSFSGEYRIGIDLDVDVLHKITVSPDDYEQVKAALDNQDIYSASVSGSMSIYNPGSERREEVASNVYAHVELNDAQLSGDINNSIALASLSQTGEGESGQELIAELADVPPEPETQPVHHEKDVKLAQASCNLFVENEEPVLEVTGVPDEPTTNCLKSVLGEAYEENDWGQNAAVMQEMMSGSDTAQDKITALAGKAAQKDIPNASTEAYMLQAGLEGLEFDGIVGPKTIAAAQEYIAPSDNPHEMASQTPETKSLTQSFQDSSLPDQASNDPDFSNEVPFSPADPQDALPIPA